MGTLNGSVLLDTHVLLWALAEPMRLSEEQHRLLADRRTNLVVSAVSGWEIALKHGLGKLPQADGIVATLPTHVARLGATVLEISLDHALHAGSLSWEHRDPFDRLLWVQALQECMALATADPVFEALSGVRLIR